MMNRNSTTLRTIAGSRAFVAALALTLAAGTLLGTAGCEEKKEVAKAPPPPPPPPPPPEPVDIASVLKNLGADKRVQFPQDHAPVNAGLADAIVKFASSLAKGDATTFGSMLEPSSRQTLDQLTGSGEWEDAVEKIEAVRVTFSAGMRDSDAVGGAFVLAIQEPGSAYVLSWAVMSAGDRVLFAAMPSSKDTKPRASDWDNDPALPAAAGPEPSAAPAAPEAPAEATSPPDSSGAPSGGGGGSRRPMGPG
jgi:hypothetical protein